MKLQLKNLNTEVVLKNKILILLCVFALSGCIHQMPSTLEVAAHGVERLYIISVQTLTTGNVYGMIIKMKELK